MAQILTRSEIERMKASTAPNPQLNSTLRKQELKRLSDEKVRNWPNTLDALRKKKESFHKEKEDIEELRRQEIDRQVNSYIRLG
jgi:hypothetical protein